MIVEFNAVTKRYSSGEGVEDLSFNIAQGEVVGLLGLNGSGKTTTLKLCSGLLWLTGGTIRFNGLNPRRARERVAFLGDRQAFQPWMTSRDVERLLTTLHTDFRPALFSELLYNLQAPIGKPLQTLSRGEQQKLRLAATMARKCDLYLLDEPLSGIDLIARTGILNNLIASWEPASSIIISTHEINDVEAFLTRVLFLNRGRIAANETSAAIHASGASLADRFISILGGGAC